MMNLKALKQIPPWEWPEGTGSALLTVLRDDQATASDRLLAAELAGDPVVMNDKLADALLSIVRSDTEPVELRGQAAIALGPALEHGDTTEFEEPDEIVLTETMFHRVQHSLRELYANGGVPELVRRRVLEASVRAPQDWHADAVRTAWSSGSEDWRLTAVFGMEFIRGFDDEILEALKSTNPGIHYHAVQAAGNWGVQAAWPDVAEIVEAAAEGEEVDRPLLLAAIEAVAGIQPEAAADVLGPLTESEDDEIAEAAFDALAMTDADFSEDETDDDED